MKKIIPVAAAFLLAFALFSSTAFAVPASPDPFTITQPDGTSFEVLQKGDEFMNWTETVAGYTIVKNPDTGVWEYAITSDCGELMPSGIAVVPGEAPPEGLPKHIRPPARDGRIGRPGDMPGPSF